MLQKEDVQSPPHATQRARSLIAVGSRVRFRVPSDPMIDQKTGTVTGYQTTHQRYLVWLEDFDIDAEFEESELEPCVSFHRGH